MNATDPPIELHTTPIDEPPEVRNVRLLARLLDSAVTVPGTQFRVGLDPVLGLLPGVGDAAAAVIGSYILVSAVRLGLPKPVLGRMLLNIGADALFGSVPVVGDVADAAWRANARNAALFDRAYREPRETRRASLWLIVGVVAAVLTLVGFGIGLSVLLVWLLFVR